MASQSQCGTASIEISERTSTDILALAQLTKRIGYSDVRSLASTDQEAYEMLSGINILRDALSDAGFSPR